MNIIIEVEGFLDIITMHLIFSLTGSVIEKIFESFFLAYLAPPIRPPAAWESYEFYNLYSFYHTDPSNKNGILLVVFKKLKI